jgi:GntR family transcriptional regulator
MPADSIDRASPVPYYFQLAELIEKDILDGTLANGAQLPSEPELCESYAVSRTTVRQALARLDQRGFIDRRKGRGTFVQRTTTPGHWLLQSSHGFFQDEVDRLGRTVTSELLSSGAAELPDWASEALAVPAGSAGAIVERLRSVDGQVALYVINYLQERVAGAVDGLTPNESLYRRLKERAGVEPAGGQRIVQAIAADDHIARLLELDPGAPVALIESVSWNSELVPFDVYRAWLRTDRMSIDIHVLT